MEVGSRRRPSTYVRDGELTEEGKIDLPVFTDGKIINDKYNKYKVTFKRPDRFVYTAKTLDDVKNALEFIINSTECVYIGDEKGNNADIYHSLKI